MTICMAAICDDGRSVVTASDKMLTASFLALEFEHPEAKIGVLGSHCLSLSAGDALAATDLLAASGDLAQKLQAPTVEMITNDVKEKFIALRQQNIEDNIFRPRGFNFRDFYQKGLISQIPGELAMLLDSQVQKSRFDVDLLIAGIDQSGAHIYGVRDPGVVACYDGLGYHAIGSGERHALLNIIGSNYQRSRGLNEAVYAVFEAKKHAELAQGVGVATEIRIVTADGITAVNNNQFDKLKKIHDRKMSPQLKEINEQIENLPFQGEASHDGDGAAKVDEIT